MNNELLVAARFTYPEYEWVVDDFGVHRHKLNPLRNMTEKVYFNPHYNNDDLMALMDKVMKHRHTQNLDVDHNKHYTLTLWITQNRLVAETLPDLFIKAACVLEESDE